MVIYQLIVCISIVRIFKQKMYQVCGRWVAVYVHQCCLFPDDVVVLLFTRPIVQFLLIQWGAEIYSAYSWSKN